MNTPPEAGLRTPDVQQLDLNSAPILYSRVSPVDRAMTKEQAMAYQRGELDAPAQTDAQRMGDASALLAPAPPPAAAAPAPVAGQPAIPVGQPAPSAAPTTPQDSPRVRDRINQLYGQKRTAEERNERLERELSDIRTMLARLAPQPPNVPYTNQYGQSPQLTYPSTSPEPSQSVDPAAGFVSRQELQSMLTQQAQALAGFFQVSNAQTASRLAAERTYPDVFQNPELVQAVDDVLASDPALQRDPRGPEKAALLVRGLVAGQAPSSPTPASVDARKQALAGVGPTVPSGSERPNDRAARYSAALEYAKRTGRLEDYARARRIQLGQE